MANPGYQSGTSQELHVHQSTVSRIIDEVSDLAVQKVNVWVKFPCNQGEINAAKLGWQERFQFPSCIGVVACTHVKIVKPTNHGDEYVNRKGFTSINVQCTCNVKEEFTSVDARWPGSVHKSRIWKNSLIRENVKGFEHCMMLGESGYAIEPWLVTPYLNPQTHDKRKYNRLFKSERVITECLLRQLKRRFPFLHHPCKVP